MNVNEIKQFVADVEVLLPDDQMRIDADRLGIAFMRFRALYKPFAAGTLADSDREELARVYTSYQRLKTEFEARYKVTFETSHLNTIIEFMENKTK